jgi:hypothetical protein
MAWFVTVDVLYYCRGPKLWENATARNMMYDTCNIFDPTFVQDSIGIVGRF